MTAVSARPGHAAAAQQALPRLIGHEFRFDLLCFLRNTQGVFFTLPAARHRLTEALEESLGSAPAG